MFYIECFEVPRICRNVFDSLAPSPALNWSFYSKLNLELSRKMTKRPYITLTTGGDIILMIILHLIRNMLLIK